MTVTGPVPDADQRLRALLPVTDALVGRAREQAGEVRARAERAATETLQSAREEAARIDDEARSQGREEARLLAVTERAQARREARSIVLRARAEAYERLCEQVRAKVRGLRDDPCYPRLLARLTELARAAVAAETAVTEPPAAPVIEEAPEGGVIATAPGLRVDLSADALAERAVAALGAEVMELWQPRSSG